MSAHTIQIGGQSFQVRPLTLAAFGRLSAKLGLLSKLDGRMPGAEEVDAIFELILEAIRKDHGELTREKLEEEMTLAEGLDAVRAIFAASGLISEETPAAGEAPASP